MFSNNCRKPTSESVVVRMFCSQRCEWSAKGFSSEVHARSTEGESDWGLCDMLPLWFLPKPVVRCGKRERAYNRFCCNEGVQGDKRLCSRRQPKRNADILAVSRSSSVISQEVLLRSLGLQVDGCLCSNVYTMTVITSVAMLSLVFTNSDFLVFTRPLLPTTVRGLIIASASARL